MSHIDKVLLCNLNRLATPGHHTTQPAQDSFDKFQQPTSCPTSLPIFKMAGTMECANSLCIAPLRKPDFDDIPIFEMYVRRPELFLEENETITGWSRAIFLKILNKAPLWFGDPLIAFRKLE
ncbi:uncharacterized protein PAC_12210 [Phialocephala subalpina]|uniref:Uncharacterized protein n=1 Tax=Phialocephala subalpina TaxID=576137 RepID=A0A1L7XBB8_9HELO|nr:uncharacterized protein PAC_12210 [Phialocephala subalpina]